MDFNPDAFESIVDVLITTRDIPTLCNLSLACRTFRLCIRTRLLRTAVVRSTQNATSMVKCFDSNPEVYMLVYSLTLETRASLDPMSFSLLTRLRSFERLRELRLHDRFSPSLSREFKAFSLHPVVLHSIPIYSKNIHTLRLGPLRFASIAELARFLCAFPTVRHLGLSNLLVRSSEPPPEFLGLRMAGNVKLNTLQIVNVPHRLTRYAALSANLDLLTTLTIDSGSLCRGDTLDADVHDKLLGLRCLRHFTLLLLPNSHVLSAVYEFEVCSMYASILAIQFRKGALDHHLVATPPQSPRDESKLLQNLAGCRYLTRRGKTTSTCTLGPGSFWEDSEPVNVDFQVQTTEGAKTEEAAKTAKGAQTFWVFILGDLFARLPNCGIIQIEPSVGDRVLHWDNFANDGSESPCARYGEKSLPRLPIRDVSSRIRADSDSERNARKHGKSVEGLAVSPDSAWVASVDEATVIFWDASDQSVVCRWKFDGDNKQFACLAFSPDSTRLAFLYKDQPMIWDFDAWTYANKPPTALSGHTNLVNHISWSPDGQNLASGTWDDKIRIWDGHTYQLLHVLELPEHGHFDIFARFSPDSTLLASCRLPDRLQIWDVETGKLKLEKCTVFESDCLAAAFDPEGTRIATGYEDGSVHIWDIQTGEELVKMHECTQAVWDISFSKDGQDISYASADGTVRICNSVSGDLLLSLKGHEGSVRRAQWSPDKQYIASASDDHTVRLWRRSDGQCIATFNEHNKGVRHLAFSPDGKTVSSGAEDGTVCIRVLKDLVPGYGL